MGQTGDPRARSGDGLPFAAVVSGAAPVPGATLHVLDPDAAHATIGLGRVRRTIHRLRAAAGTPVAAPASPDGALDGWNADLLLVPLPGDVSAVCSAVLAAGVRAAGRPVLVDVNAPGTSAEAVVAAIDVGAIGAVVRLGDGQEDRRLIEDVLELERRRLDDAPLASVIVCNYNDAENLERCLASLGALEHPRFEVIVVDDGSTDHSVAVAHRHGVRVVQRQRGGLTLARNAGLEAAQGRVVAFIDADAYAPIDWLARIWRMLDRAPADGTGGANAPVPGATWQERVVAAAPGWPIPVVKPSGDALHLTGCNMAFRRAAVDRVGGFDVRLVSAGDGDDVDLCNRLIAAGARLTYHPSAPVYHRRRATVAGFLRQQRSYGQGSARHVDRHRTPGPIPVASRSRLQKLDPRRPRPVFVGPEPRQVFTLAGQNIHADLPLKLLVLGSALAIAGAGPAVLMGRGRAWAGLSCAGMAAMVATMAARVPAVEPSEGLPELAQRIVTVGVWLGQPLAWRLGQHDARRTPDAGPRSDR